MLGWVLAASAANAAGSDLEPVAKALAIVRASKPINDERDAGPELNAVKTSLRLWAESRFERFRPFVPISDGASRSATGLDTLEAQLNADLKNADLTCDGVKAPLARCGDPGAPGYGPRESSRGYVGGVTLQFLEDNRYLLLETTVGVVCGYDESAYLYKWRNARWQLILAAETNDYRKGRYGPQELISVEASPANVAWNEPARKPPLVLTLGFSPWCSSNWQALYVRLWRVSPSTVAPKPLLDISPTLFMGDEPRVAAGSITADDVLIQFEGNSIDSGERTHVLHYAIGENDRLERIAPVALNPRDFVDEWLTSPWSEAAMWSRTPPKLEAFHRSHHKDFLLGEFDGDAKRCRSDDALWQIGFAANGEKDDTGETFYYLVRWDAPYRFTLEAVRDRSFAGCDIPAKSPDTFGTLFPLQDWRR
ncbi:MAG TPA: hypothetical protein VMD53_14595 [Rhizomicrobium sp.]|nr:hypothetical protein [Rhizomicrobium sp.]